MDFEFLPKSARKPKDSCLEDDIIVYIIWREYMSITILGMIAGVLTSCAFIPQAYKVIQTKRTQDISIPMYSIFTFGVFFWIIYGLMIKDMAILLTNIVTFIPALIILILTVKNLLGQKKLIEKQDVRNY